jgi:putative RNA 2'-phosphotransferase
MNQDKLIRTSKYLSRHLRHAPEDLGLTLEPGGWVLVQDLLEACARAGRPISRDLLDEVVRSSDKQRFSFDEDGRKIRANQGHSVEIDLQLPPTAPPPILYHGTADKNWNSILEKGLTRMRRHHVHLSADVETAQRVGARHGRPLVLEIDTAAMREAGYEFFRSENGVWLVSDVPPDFIENHRGS